MFEWRTPVKKKQKNKIKTIKIQTNKQTFTASGLFNSSVTDNKGF
jgi:hypothetical protein